MIGPFVNSFYTVFRATLTLMQPGLKRYVIAPLLINTVLFAGTLYWAISVFSEFMDRWLPSWLDWLNWLLIPLFSITLMIMVFYTFTLVANIIAAPFNSLLAEKYAKSLGHIAESSNETISQLVTRTVSSEFKKLSYTIVWLVLLLILTMIPVVNLAAPFLWALFASWMLSLEYLDYPMGNNNCRFGEIRQNAHQHKARTLGLGSGLFLLTSIPFINFIAIPAGVIAATDIYIKQLGQEK